MVLNHSNAFGNLTNGTFDNVVQGMVLPFDNAFGNAFGTAFGQLWVMIFWMFTLFLMYNKVRSIEGIAIINVVGVVFLNAFIVTVPFVEGILYATSVLGLSLLMYKFWRSR